MIKLYVGWTLASIWQYRIGILDQGYGYFFEKVDFFLTEVKTDFVLTLNHLLKKIFDILRNVADSVRI